jgi:hypothetical protein
VVGFTTGSRGEVPGKKENLWQEMMMIIIIITIFSSSKKLSRFRRAGPKGERQYSSYSFLTSALDGPVLRSYI